MTNREQDRAAALVRATPINLAYEPMPSNIGPALAVLAMVPVYREGTHCPGCGRRHWIIGRSTAQCAFCDTALVLETPATEGAGLFRHGPGRIHADEIAA